MQEQVWSVSDFVAVLNQTLEFAYPNVIISGELANFRISKNRWVYFDLKDEASTIKLFGTVYNLPGPLEDGMLLRVRGAPRLHPQYGFSVNIQTIQPIGEGSIKKASHLLGAKLAAEGLFDESRKRSLPYPPRRIGLITSSESAAYHDFIKVLNARWGGVEIHLIDVRVQGDLAVTQIVAALSYFETYHEPVDVVVLTRGGGNSEDLAVFNTEQVTRAVASSRVPTMVAIGHEVDTSLAELAADQRASTPSNAAELLVPDKKHVQEQLLHARVQLLQATEASLTMLQTAADGLYRTFSDQIKHLFAKEEESFIAMKQLLEAFNPQTALKRGYAIVRSAGKIIRTGRALKLNQRLSLSLSDARVDTIVDKIDLQ